MTEDEILEALTQPKEIDKMMATGVDVIMHLFGGPQEWRKLPPLALDPDIAKEAAKVARGREQQYAGLSWIDTQRKVTEIVLSGYWAAFERWAKREGRTDLLVDSIDLVNAALPRDEQLRRPEPRKVKDDPQA